MKVCDEIFSIKDVVTTSFNFFDKALSLGYIIYFDSESTLNVVSTSSFEQRCTNIKGCSDYYISENKIWLKLKNVIKTLDIDSCKTSLLCKTEKDNISFINSNYCRGGSSFRNPRRQINDVIDIRSNKAIYTWTDNKSILTWLNKNPLFFNKESKIIFSLDLVTNKPNWELELDSGFAGVRYIQDGGDRKLFLQRYLKFGEYNVLKLDIDSGEIIWEKENTLNFYNYDSLSNKLYGLGGNSFEVLDAETGRMDHKTNIDENLHISPNLTHYQTGFLYFSGYKNNNIPVFGAVNVNDGKLVFIHVVQLDGGKSFRKGLGKPVVIGNRLYVQDSLKTLHVFELPEELIHV